MKNFWFCLYHLYSTSTEYNKKALIKFEKDVRFAAEKLEIEYVIMEDYYKNLNWGEYSNFWNKTLLNKMIKIIHDYSMKIILYTDVTELSIKTETFKKYGKKWGVKNKSGKILNGFNSIFLPHVYYSPKFDFLTKLMCSCSGWSDYLSGQIQYLLNELNIDGIYFDRVDYRFDCYDHFRDPSHFRRGIYDLIAKLVSEIKKLDQKYITIMNDSCMPPDDIMINCIKRVDYVLSELLPADWDPNSFYNRLNAEWGELAWHFRKILRQLMLFFVDVQFKSKSMISTSRIYKIFCRLNQYKSNNKIILFSHRVDKKGRNALKKIVRKTGANICFFNGLKPLYLLNND